MILDFSELSEHVGHDLTIGVVHPDDYCTLPPIGVSLDCHTCGNTIDIEYKQEDHHGEG